MSSSFFHTKIFSFLVALLHLKCLLLPVESASPSLITDKEALISFKSQLKELEPPTLLSSWSNSNSSPCNWTGVTCNEFRQRVIALNLSGFGLEGTISPHITNLSFLGSLQLQNNKLRGNLPPQIGNLFRLTVMNLSSNSLEGEIPLNISKLTKLQVLDLMSNKITGTIPEELSHLSKLQVLNLGRNSLLGEISASLSNLSSLTYLNLGTNSLSGRIPGDLGRLGNLKVLDLTINNLFGTVPSSIYNMSSLVNLALASNRLWGEIPYDIGNKLPNLLVFNYCFNNFTGKIPGSLHNLTNIQVIRMAHNLLEGTVPPGLGNLPFLQMYNIGFNRIVSSGDDGLAFITSLANSTRLNFLAVDGNAFEGVISESVGNLSKVLSKLYMGSNRIYGKIPLSIGRLRSLTLLNLNNNSISGGVPDVIGQLKELQYLGLAGNKISGSIPNSLGNLRKLNQIDLSGNELVGGIPTSFENFQSLLSLDLSNNRLNKSVPKEILNLPSLSTILNLSRNFLDGPLPQEVGVLENVVTIDLSHNRLSGNIPSSFEGCKSLEELLMANNEFSGTIPNTLGEVKGLEVLDLSSNQLSGSIPSDLQKLEALRSLNLSYNNLEGQIPSSGVFKNISNVHLEGNQKLCMHLGCANSQSDERLNKIYVITAVMAAMAVCFLIALVIVVRRRKTKATGASELSNGKPQMISYSELRQATGNFNQENVIGSGSFGSVYKGYLIEGIHVAVKVLDIKRTGSWKSFLAECEALKNVRHRNLVKLITSCSSLDFRNMEFLALVYEFLSNGSLADWTQGQRKNENGKGLSFLQRLNISIDVASALDYLHHDCEIPIVHCDLKPGNILLDEEMTAKVGDFGLARLLHERRSHQSSISSTVVVKGSIGYIPPEYGLGEKPSTSGDVYSFGVMLLELFTGMSPIQESFSGELNLVKWVESSFPENVMQVLDAELNNLQHQGQSINPEKQNHVLITIIGVGLSCTKDSPDRRISIREALRSLKTAKDTFMKHMK
ncbi:LRR receptor-like serine/threonine-protein kinase EFR [Pistacia vera]|uniref:LRR receptor-like serine/threonine-protein kinase EFR n=1 Tax=Pistacia vera TaxID=55513 RepID=UPI001263E02E|nr:LRR receptor-like serine/threonine-protein kinase EFR [Pistacia vera]XP_031283271.1 LRR receptor-like serine/threonine-protein kinase EFR [Pistacia vera]